jgi:hypothetical protein
MRRLIAVLVLWVLAWSAPPIEAAAPSSMTGVVSWVPDSLGHRYLALPVRGEPLTVELCGPADCAVLTQTDLGPDRRVHPDRIADVSRSMFEALCGCPASTGLFRGSWRVVGEQLPETDTGGTP